MKNVFAGIVTILFLVIIYASVASPRKAATPPTKDYTLKLNDAQVAELWSVIQASNAPHLQVVDIQTLIQTQIAAQQDTTKKK